VAEPNPAPIAPVPSFPERARQVYEVILAEGVPRRKGPLLFEEGLSTDPSISPDYLSGVLDGDRIGPGSTNHNAPYVRQSPERTAQQRAHLARPVEYGNPLWTKQDQYLGGFAAGTSPEGEETYLKVTRSGRPYRRQNAAEISEDIL